MRSLRTALLLVLAACPIALAQPEPPKKSAPQPVPADLVLSDLRSAYSHITADEVAVRFRPPAGSGATERTDTFVIRIDPGDAVAPEHPRAVLLELGALRIYLAAGKLTAINTAVAEKVFTRTYAEPLTPGVLAQLLPPLPVPQLALLAKSDPGFKSPLTSLTEVSWEGAAPDEGARPPVVLMKGSSPAGTVELIMNIQSRRLARFTATIRRGSSEGTLDLSIRSIDTPGDPAKWVINSEGRQSVASLMDLKPSTRPLPPVEPGQPVPNIGFSKFDMSTWTLFETIDAPQPRLPMALLLFRYPAAPDRAEAALRDARAGLAALRLAQRGPSQPTEPAAPLPPGTKFLSAAAAVIELGEFTRDRWDQARKGWGAVARARTGGSDGSIGADDLMWSSSPAQSIDRLAPATTAVIAIIRPDHTLVSVIPLDGRFEKVTDIAGEIAEAIKRAEHP